MKDRTVTHGTFVIERQYPVSPDRVFAAFSDPAKKRRWLLGGKQAEEFTMDFRVGGIEHSSSRFPAGTPFEGTTLANDTNYLDIVDNARIVIAYSMSIGDRRISSSLATFELVPTPAGTNLIFTDQGAYFEGSDGAQIREAGWRKLLEQLGNEVSEKSSTSA
jgi:uncharacterized protein YndB with AHSA1/START domain